VLLLRAKEGPDDRVEEPRLRWGVGSWKERRRTRELVIRVRPDRRIGRGWCQRVDRHGSSRQRLRRLRLAVASSVGLRARAGPRGLDSRARIVPDAREELSDDRMGSVRQFDQQRESQQRVVHGTRIVERRRLAHRGGGRPRGRSTTAGHGFAVVAPGRVAGRRGRPAMQVAALSPGELPAAAPSAVPSRRARVPCLSSGSRHNRPIAMDHGSAVAAARVEPAAACRFPGRQG
jgi:hypothetical protein